MKYVLTNAEAKLVDSKTINDYHVPSLVLMERAITEIYYELKSRFTNKTSFLIINGCGNNGADAVGVARLLHNDNYKVKVVNLFNNYSPELNTELDISKNYGVKISKALEDQDFLEYDIVLEGIFGSGLDREVRGQAKDLINKINDKAKFIISVDIPSGLSATTGEILGTSIKANLTITIGTHKLGLFIKDGPKVAGELVLREISLARPTLEKENFLEYLDYDLLKESFTKRSNFTNKGNFKKVLMIGGAASMPGALEMAVTSAERSGVGTLTILTTEKVKELIYPRMPYAMFLTSKDSESLGLDTLDILDNNLASFNLVEFGNGTTRNPNTSLILEKLLKSDKNLILDADSLFFLHDYLDLLTRDSLTVITPHIKELSYITGLSTNEILKDPLTITKDLVNKYPNLIIVLKSSFTLVVSKDRSGILAKPNSALAKGGSGDILAGIITGYLAKENDYYKAVTEAVITHSLIAKLDLASEVVTPLELMDNLNKIYQELNKISD